MHILNLSRTNARLWYVWFHVWKFVRHEFFPVESSADIEQEKTQRSRSPRSKLDRPKTRGDVGGRGGEGGLPGKVTQVVPMYGTTRKLPHNGDAARN